MVVRGFGSPLDTLALLRFTQPQLGPQLEQLLMQAVAMQVYSDLMTQGGMGPFANPFGGFAPQLGGGGGGVPDFSGFNDPGLLAELAAMRIAATSGRGAGAVAPRPVRARAKGAEAPTGQRVPTQSPPKTGGAAPVAPLAIPQNATADGKLATIQGAAIDSAQRELDAKVTLGKNPDRVQEYRKNGGMDGGHWCGYFTGFNYDQAAKQAGGRFGTDARIKFHSMQKARAYFEYSNYTKGTNDDGLRAKHEAEGSTRRWMVLEGSTGQAHAAKNQRPHETYQGPGDLPVRKGDTVLFSFGHVGMVKDYDPATGKLVTIEGNAGGGAVREITRNLNNPKHRAQIEGFGRPALGDFELPGK